MSERPNESKDLKNIEEIIKPYIYQKIEKTYITGSLSKETPDKEAMPSTVPQLSTDATEGQPDLVVLPLEEIPAIRGQLAATCENPIPEWNLIDSELEPTMLLKLKRDIK